MHGLVAQNRLMRAIALVTFIATSEAAFAQQLLTIDEYVAATLGNQIADAITKGNAFANSKQEANLKYAAARAAFFAEIDKGEKGSAAEKEFGGMLRGKDIYYLSLYVSEGMFAAKKRVNALDTLTSGSFDGGIDAEDTFSAWVQAVRTELGEPKDGRLLFVANPRAFQSAIEKTADVYDRYRMARDRKEYQKWSISRRKYSPKPKTPEDFADIYINYSLNASIETALAELPESERSSAAEKLRVWTEQLRAAIIDFENVELTPEKTVAYLREKNDGDDAIAFFLRRLGDTSKLNAKEVWPAITRAWLDTIARDQQIREPRLHPHLPEEESLKSLLRGWVFGRERGKLTASQLAEMQQYKLRERASYLPFDKLNYLFGPGQPMKISRANYFLDRNLMVAKKGLWIEPKPFVKPPVLESEKRDKDKKDAEDAAKAVESAQHKARLAEQRQHDEAKAKASAVAEKEALAKKAEEEKINSERQKRIAAVEEEKSLRANKSGQPEPLAGTSRRCNSG